jgi:hypothetical protein
MVSTERLGDALPKWHDEQRPRGDAAAWRVTAAAPLTSSLASSEGPPQAAQGIADPEAEAVAFVRFCYRRRAVAWPELYDEMCAVAARGDYRGMGYEQLEGMGIRFALAALPRLAEMAARVIAEERGRQPTATAA